MGLGLWGASGFPTAFFISDRDVACPPSGLVTTCNELKPQSHSVFLRSLVRRMAPSYFAARRKVPVFHIIFQYARLSLASPVLRSVTLRCLSSAERSRYVASSRKAYRQSGMYHSLSIFHFNMQGGALLPTRPSERRLAERTRLPNYATSN